MMEIFGRKSSPGKDNLNVLGQPIQTQEKEEDTKVQQTPEEGESKEQVETSSEETGESEQQVADENQNEDNEEENIEKKDSSKLAGKFENRVSLIDGIANIGEKLGKKIDPAKVQETDTNELVEVYEELEQELGNTSDIDQTRQVNQSLKEENQQYKQELNSLKQEMNKINQYLQNIQMQNQNPQPNMQTNPNVGQSPAQPQTQKRIERDPNTGRFVSKSQQQNQQQTQQNQQSKQDQQTQQNQQNNIDPDEWLRDFYKNPVEAVQKINNMNNQQQQEIKQNMNEQQKQDFRQQQQEMLQQRRQRYRQRLNQKQKESFKRQTSKLEEEYGEEFKNPDTKKAILSYMQKHPIYLHPDIFPNGVEIAYNEIRKQRQNRNKGDNKQMENNQVSVEEKKAANLPKSQGSNIQTNSADDKGQAIKDSVFKKGSGLFK